MCKKEKPKMTVSRVTKSGEDGKKRRQEYKSRVSNIGTVRKERDKEKCGEKR